MYLWVKEGARVSAYPNEIEGRSDNALLLLLLQFVAQPSVVLVRQSIGHRLNRDGGLGCCGLGVLDFSRQNVVEARPCLFELLLEVLDVSVKCCNRQLLLLLQLNESVVPLRAQHTTVVLQTFGIP